MKKVLVIAGPTASGKSDFAVEVAKKVGGIIISGDQTCIFTGSAICGKMPTRHSRKWPTF